MVTAHLATEQPLRIERSIDIEAPLDIAFEALLEQLGPGCEVEPDKLLSMKLEAWPGGRWFRDLGNNTGHLWGHVQVIKPPLLLEICGPMCMSYPSMNHVQFRLVEHGNGSRLTLLHRAIGEILPEHREGMPGGWFHDLKRVRDLAERRANA